MKNIQWKRSEIEAIKAKMYAHARKAWEPAAMVSLLDQVTSDWFWVRYRFSRLDKCTPTMLRQWVEEDGNCPLPQTEHYTYEVVNE